jgi:simple sugar transport system ATP-binding protein
LAEQPTRGVDLGAARAVHEALLRHRDAGHGVLLISADVGELLALADRVLVMYEGRILGALDRDQADEATIGRLMAGQGAA